MKTHAISILTSLLGLFTNSGDAQWTPVPTDLPYNEQAAYATDQNAFLVGFHSPGLHEIYAHASRSTDGGRTFEIFLSKADSKYSVVHFVNDQMGFIAGDHDFNAVVLKTTDGGTTWETTMLDLSGPPEFKDFLFINDEVGFIIGGNGIDLIFKTENGGDSWHNISFSDGPSLSGISFVDDSIGFVSSVFGDIYKTFDQGDNWELLPHLPPVDRIHAMHFITENTGLIGNIDGEIYRTENGGEDWTQINLPGVDSTFWMEFHFVNDITGFLMTHAEGEAKLFQTIDGGEIWIEIFKANEPYTWDFMAFSPTNTNALLGGGSSLFVHDDAEELVVTSSLNSAIKELSEFTFSPNPATNEIDVAISFDSRIPFEVNLVDVVGKIYDTKKVEGSEVQTQLLLNTLAAGMYYIQIVTRDGVAVSSFVKQ